jgi:hypothetical protein
MKLSIIESSDVAQLYQRFVAALSRHYYGTGPVTSDLTHITFTSELVSKLGFDFSELSKNRVIVKSDAGHYKLNKDIQPTGNSQPISLHKLHNYGRMAPKPPPPPPPPPRNALSIGESVENTITPERLKAIGYSLTRKWILKSTEPGYNETRVFYNIRELEQFILDAENMQKYVQEQSPKTPK